MTQNQIAYWNMQEQGRHNVATETETNRHNVRTEDETERHNRFNENIDLGKLNETIRHNKATETYSLSSLDENKRHNLASEMNESAKIGEMGRSNLMSEYLENLKITENVRHNRNNEALQNYDLNIKSQSVDETARHNYETELQNRDRVNAQNALDRSKAKYQDMLTTWDRISKIQTNAESQARIDELQRRIQKYNTEISKLESDIERNNTLNGVDKANAISRGIDVISEELYRWLQGGQG